VKDEEDYGIPDEVLVQELPNGFLQCENDGTDVWCSHIESVITNNLDSISMWERKGAFVDADGKEFASIIVQVPLAPTKKIWLEAELQSCDMPQTRWLVLPEFEAVELPPLGFVHEGEGRGVLRSMILDWFNGVSDPDATCSNKGHGWDAQMVWEADLLHSGLDRFAQLWSVFTANECLTCSSKTFDLSEFVPVEEKGAGWGSTK
jgi:hypothetical protein